ncbi:MAG: U32 family peptidase [Clostridiales bacterium]|nr:U32 family peptidase [Clostridiales bacterium]
MKKIELLAPAGNFEKLKTALYYGADAVYVGGKSFSLRAFSNNFTNEELAEAIDYTHSLGKKIYVTVNAFMKNHEIEKIKEYLEFLYNANVDAVIVTDPGVIYLAKTCVPNLELHLSTQANTLNKASVEFWKSQGVKRIVLARELSLGEIKEISDSVQGVELEAFIHGAMCISYSGRCLLSNYLTGRDSNRGECVQACRWNFGIKEVSKDGDYYPIEEDERGTYILNSKDLNMIEHIGEMISAGVISFKIEGRMKGEYYLATVINAYRRAIDEFYEKGVSYKDNTLYMTELKKTFHRAFTTAYAFGDNDNTVNYENSQSTGDSLFVASVLGYDENRGALVEMRNRFKVGDTLEILSPSDNFNKTFVVSEIEDEFGNSVTDAKNVQQKLYIKVDYKLNKGDILRRSLV